MTVGNREATQFDLARLTLEDVGRFYTGEKTNSLSAMADVMSKATPGEDGAVAPDLLDLEYGEFNRQIKAFKEADKSFAEKIEPAGGVKVDLKKITARRMDAFYVALRANDLIGTSVVIRECVNSWPEGDLSYSEYLSLLKVFADAVKKTATT